MNNKWRTRLSELLEKEDDIHNTTAALREAPTESIPTGPGRSEKNSTAPLNTTHKTHKTPTDAERLGLIATWSGEFGYVSLHDPASGEWHDLKTKDAPEWAVGEARRRKDLYRDGNRKAYRLTSREMEELWEAEHPPEEEGIIEEYAIENEE